MRFKHKEIWLRRELDDFFTPASHPVYPLAIPADVAVLRRCARERELSFQRAMVWLAAKVMDEAEKFRVKIRGEDLILRDHLVDGARVEAPFQAPERRLEGLA